MDNLTHSLVGLAAGECLARVLPARDAATAARRRVTFIALGIVGGNLPDLDLVASYADGKLGYLLQHRGHTHTLVGCAILALLLFALATATLRWKRGEAAPGEWRGIALMSVVSVFLHVALDSLNSYGVHPYWPFDNRWRYGDAVFIIEPLYWIAAAPLVLAQRTRAARIVMGAVVAVAIGLHVFVHRGDLAWILVIGAIALLLAWLGRGRAGPWLAAASMAFVTGAFLLASSQAARAAGVIAEDLPAGRTVDRVLTPVPTHPLCWDLILLRVEDGNYVARLGMLSLPPQVAAECPRVRGGDGRTVPLQPVEMPGEPPEDIDWEGTYTMPLARLREVAGADCAARGAMQFVRAPFVAISITPGGPRREVLGDLRFDREAGLGFAEIEVGDRPACRTSAPWVPPRADLLD